MRRAAQKSGKIILNKDLEYNKFEVSILSKDLIIEDSSIFTDIGTDLSLLKKQFKKLIEVIKEI